MNIVIKISAGEKMCGECVYKTIFHTGLVDEFHPLCEIFKPYYGEWGARDMKRSRRCIRAEKNAASSRTATPSTRTANQQEK